MLLERFQSGDRFLDHNLGLNREDSSELWNREVDKRRLEFGFSGRHLLPSRSCLDVVCVLLEVMRRISIKKV